jgi:hypothetical protein
VFVTRSHIKPSIMQTMIQPTRVSLLCVSTRKGDVHTIIRIVTGYDKHSKFLLYCKFYSTDPQTIFGIHYVGIMLFNLVYIQCR